MKYIFMGKVEQLHIIIDEWSLENRIKDEIIEYYIKNPSWMLYPDPIVNPYYYIHVSTKIKEWKQLSASDDIEYRIEKSSAIRIGGLQFNVESIEINGDGTVKCFTNHVLETVERIGQINNLQAAKEEVKRIYNELVTKRDYVAPTIIDDIDAVPAHPQATKSWWQEIKELFK